jgi:DNA modification methylase
MLELNKIYNADCLEKMKEIDDKSIDMILADLPYGTTNCAWDTIIPFEPLWEQYKRIIKDNGAIVLTASQPFTSMLVMSNIKMFKYEWIWEKEQPINIMQIKKRAGKTVENILVFYNKQPTYNPQKTKHIGKLVTNKVKSGFSSLVDSGNKKPFEYKDDGARYPTQVLKIQSERLKGYVHPTQKPVALGRYLVRTYTNEGDLVLDNTCGSGSFLVAAMLEKRNFIGIELDENYCAIARKRLEDTQKENGLG